MQVIYGKRTRIAQQAGLNDEEKIAAIRAAKDEGRIVIAFGTAGADFAFMAEADYPFMLHTQQQTYPTATEDEMIAIIFWAGCEKIAEKGCVIL